MRTRILILCALACGLAWIGIRSARAQTTLEVPGPAQQNQPYIPPRPAPPPKSWAPSGADNGDTIQLLPQELWRPAPAPLQPVPSPPPAPVNVAPMTAQALPALPAVFRGCWDGQVNQLDQARTGRAQNRFLDPEDLPAVLQTRRRSAVHAHVYRDRRRAEREDCQSARQRGADHDRRPRLRGDALAAIFRRIQNPQRWLVTDICG